ncbi:virB8 family protein [sulfur-oxidizing endosymbiont of Gigantopelta aegis]|uniref:virB8 family protein n=1 Tax=sulfur-oxidizing endosymbiont of Gigantopelta aegis TaxID=2794934 RepID=UPI0018DC62B7|nr:VirB8/TrbF family protein [sulfur-oxidizing endosymbiont of Gigantopelta aegis]
MSNDKQDKSKEIKKSYFDEVAEWDTSITQNLRKSEKRAWWVAIGASTIAVLAVVAVAFLAPLKSIEPFVVRVDNNTGYIDVISTIAETDGQIKEEAQELLDKYFLAKYVRHREGYHWNTRDYDRNVTALLSSPEVQFAYDEYSDPAKNPNAPVTVYGELAEVIIGTPQISFIRTEKVKDEKQITALVRYTKQVKKKGEFSPLTHWAATITYVYRSTPMQVKDRTINPLGFQVISYRNDQEAPQ